jgi:hypothetical protein
VTASSPGASRGSSNCLTDALPSLDTKRPRLSFQPLSGHRSGLRPIRAAARPICCPAFRPWGASRASPAPDLLYPLLTSAGRSARISPPSVLSDSQQISQGKTQHVPCVDAGCIKYTPCGWRTSRSHARSSRVHHTSYPVPVRRPAPVDGASSRPHLTVDALALLLAFGSANTWHEDLHLARCVPCLAHTP